MISVIIVIKCNKMHRNVWQHRDICFNSPKIKRQYFVLKPKWFILYIFFLLSFVLFIECFNLQENFSLILLFIFRIRNNTEGSQDNVSYFLYLVALQN